MRRIFGDQVGAERTCVGEIVPQFVLFDVGLDFIVLLKDFLVDFSQLAAIFGERNVPVDFVRPDLHSTGP